MDKVDDSLINKVKSLGSYLSGRYQLEHIFLFGSYADGSCDEWSDVDLAVVLKEEEVPGRELYSIGKDFDDRFDIFGITQKDFELSALPVIPEIKRKGIMIL